MYIIAQNYVHIDFKEPKLSLNNSVYGFDINFV